MISYMDFEDIKSVVSMNESKEKKKRKEIKYVENKKPIIKINIHIQHVCLSET